MATILPHDIPQYSFDFPDPAQALQYTIVSAGTLVIDLFGEFQGYVFFVPKSATIRKISFNISSSTLVGTITVGFWTVNSNQYSPLALYGGGDVATIVNPTAGVQTVTLATDCTFTAGDKIGLYFRCTALTSGDVRISTHQYTGSKFPYHVNDSVAYNSSNTPIFFLETSDGGTYVVPGCCGNVLNAALPTWNVNTTPDTYANKIIVPRDMTVNGIWCYWGSANGPQANGAFFIEDAVGTVLKSRTDINLNIPTGTKMCHIPYSGTPLSLKAGDVVYVGYEPNNTNAYSWTKYGWPSNAFKTIDFNTDVNLATRTDRGAWTVSTNEALLIGLTADGYDVAAGGSGSGVGPAYPFSWR